MITESLAALRETVLFATLPHVAFEGWSLRAVRDGLADAGLAADTAALAFPGGTAEMIRLWSAWSDRQMEQKVEQADLAGCRLPERLAFAVRQRIEVNSLYKEAARRTVAHLALPSEVGTAARITYDTVNALWYAAGDNAADLSFYSKRATLAAIYATTTLYWLDDDSEESGETWGFLARRIDNALFLPRLRRRFNRLNHALTAPIRFFRPGTTASTPPTAG